jgi:2-octaprenyl-6-methoxyphenol hydroxylase
MLDVAILGAGPVGATAAALASASGLAIGVFEARTAASGDRRNLALSHASRELLEAAGAWPADSATAITSIHVTQKGGPGRTLLVAHDHGLEALGYTLTYADLEAALESRLREGRIEVAYGEHCESIELASDRARLRFASGREVHARLLVLADGGANSERIPGIAYETKDYGQRAITGWVSTDRAHGGRAQERFTPGGPAALLPMGNGYALVVIAAPAEAERLLALGDAEFLESLQELFGDRAGRFVEVGPRASFALRLRTVNTPVALRAAIVGNAAQTLHPIAGQGLNLGLRDAATLAEAIVAADRESLGSEEMLEAYRSTRRRDAARGVAFTDFLVSAFADSRRIPTWGRGLALAAIDVFPAARRLLAERMMRGASRA